MRLKSVVLALILPSACVIGIVGGMPHPEVPSESASLSERAFDTSAASDAAFAESGKNRGPPPGEQPYPKGVVNWTKYSYTCRNNVKGYCCPKDPTVEHMHGFNATETCRATLPKSWLNTGKHPKKGWSLWQFCYSDEVPTCNGSWVCGPNHKVCGKDEIGG